MALAGLMGAAQMAGQLIPQFSTSSPAFSRSAADAYQAGVYAGPQAIFGADFTLVGGGNTGGSAATSRGNLQGGSAAFTAGASPIVGGFNTTTFIILAGVGIAAYFLLKKGK